MSSGKPVGTTLTQVVQQLASGMSPVHPALRLSGWWRQDSRLTIPPPMNSFVDLGKKNALGMGPNSVTSDPAGSRFYFLNVNPHP